jgi:homoserine dehydrogenase
VYLFYEHQEEDMKELKPVKLGILGMGTVASGLVNIMDFNKNKVDAAIKRDLTVTKVLVKNLGKKRNVSLPQEVYTQDAYEVINSDTDIIVELIGGINPAYEYIKAALNNKKHVVTANKALIAKHGEELELLADKNNVKLMYEASVGGGIPILNTIRENLSTNEFESVFGILNGTTNFILTQMTENGLDYDQAVKEAQRLGFAEADPSSDVGGDDAAYKLSILSGLAFGQKIHVNDIPKEGIIKISREDIVYAKELGYNIKLLAAGIKKGNEIELSVHPAFIPASHPLSTVKNEYNAVYLKGNAVGELLFYGKGIPQSLMVGVLVSGAFIADKISPLSGLLNLIMTTVNKNYKEVFKSMIITLVPTILATSVIYFLMGSNYIAEGENLLKYKEAIQQGFNISPALFILPALVLFLSVFGLDSLKTFSIGILAGGALSIIFQQSSISSLTRALIFGYRGNTPSEELNALLVSGGMVSMIEATFIVSGAFILIKLFERGNVLVPLMDKLINGINNKRALIKRTGLISILMTVATCDQTSGIILPGTILQEKYEELKLDKAVLARTISDTGVIVAPLMPWNINSFLIKPVMGITAAQYSPFAVLCYVCPLMSMIVSYIQYRQRNSDNEIRKKNGITL